MFGSARSHYLPHVDSSKNLAPIVNQSASYIGQALETLRVLFGVQDFPELPKAQPSKMDLICQNIAVAHGAEGPLLCPPLVFSGTAEHHVCPFCPCLSIRSFNMAIACAQWSGGAASRHSKRSLYYIDVINLIIMSMAHRANTGQQKTAVGDMTWHPDMGGCGP